MTHTDSEVFSYCMILHVYAVDARVRILRVLAVVAHCCSVDMRWAESIPHVFFLRIPLVTHKK